MKASIPAKIDADGGKNQSRSRVLGWLALNWNSCPRIKDFLSQGGGADPGWHGTGARRGPAPNAQGAIPLERGDQVGTSDFGPPPIKERNGGWEPKREAPDTPATC